jgi:hypothetical protein
VRLFFFSSWLQVSKSLNFIDLFDEHTKLNPMKGLLSRSVKRLEKHLYLSKLDPVPNSEDGASKYYNVEHSVWHLNCCNPDMGTGVWPLLNAVLGVHSFYIFYFFFFLMDILPFFVIQWDSDMTYSSVGVYIAFWWCLTLVLITLKCVKKRTRTSN